MRNRITNKEKEVFFRVAYTQYKDWLKKPEDSKNILDRMGIYVTLFTQFENRMRVLYWTTTFYEPFLYPTRQNDKISLTKVEFTRIIEDPYPPNAPDHIGLGLMNSLLERNKVIRKDKFEEMVKVINLRNELNHQFFLKQDKLNDEDIGDVVDLFRYLDKRLKQKRNVYKKRRGNREMGTKRRVIRFKSPE